MMRALFLGAFVFLVGVLSAGHCLAAGQPRVPREFIPYFERAAARYDVPVGALYSISYVESGFKPWAMNVAGRPVFFKSREETVAAVRYLLSIGHKNFDTGLMQINVQWIRRYNISPELIVDPGFNTLFGAWVLHGGFSQHGANWKALASYHTSPDRNRVRAEWYARQVVANWYKLSAESPPSEKDMPSRQASRKTVVPVDHQVAGSAIKKLKRVDGFSYKGTHDLSSPFADSRAWLKANL